MDLKLKDILVLIFSIAAIYFLAPILDHQQGVLVSLSFSLILILSSQIIWDRAHRIRYALYILIALWTYFLLFSEQPWESLTHNSQYESSALPLIVSSIIMSLNGWLLLSNRHERFIYTIVTLGLQIPIAIGIGSDSVQQLFALLSQSIHYQEHYALSVQLWQFEWMMTYYLPIYFLRHLKVRQST